MGFLDWSGNVSNIKFYNTFNSNYPNAEYNLNNGQLELSGNTTIVLTEEYFNSNHAEHYYSVVMTGTLTDSNYKIFGGTIYPVTGDTKLIAFDAGDVDTTSLTTMESMFVNCTFLKSVNLSNIDTSNVVNMTAMFYSCSNLTSINVSNFDTSNVRDMGYMFSGCGSLTSIDLSNLITSNVTAMNDMFGDCGKLTSIDLSSFNTSKVTTMWGMFMNCQLITTINVSNFDTSNVRNMGHMFYGCGDLKEINLSSFNTSNVTNMSRMFSLCRDLETLNLSTFDTSNVSNISYMFYKCDSLKAIAVSNNFKTANITNTSITTNADQLKYIFIHNDYINTYNQSLLKEDLILIGYKDKLPITFDIGYPEANSTSDTTQLTFGTTIIPTNNPPEISSQPDTVNTFEDTTTKIALYPIFKDVDNYTYDLTFTHNYNGTDAVIDICNGALIFTPRENYYNEGTDALTFSVTATDPSGASVSVPLTFSIANVYDNPTSDNSSNTILEDTELTIVFADISFSSIESADISYIKIIGFPNYGDISGTYTINGEIRANNDFKYIPNLNIYGSDSFTFSVVDTNGYTSNVYQYSITINPRPRSANKSVTTSNNLVVSFSISDFEFTPGIGGGTLDSIYITDICSNNIGALLINDVSYTSVQSDTLALNSSTTLQYVPNSNEFGISLLTFKVGDTNGIISSTTYTLTIEQNSIQSSNNFVLATENIAENTVIKNYSDIFNYTNYDGSTTLTINDICYNSTIFSISHDNQNQEITFTINPNRNTLFRDVSNNLLEGYIDLFETLPRENELVISGAISKTYNNIEQQSDLYKNRYLLV